MHDIVLEPSAPPGATAWDAISAGAIAQVDTQRINDTPDTVRSFERRLEYHEEELPDAERVVLVVDDDYAIREALSDVLSALGYNVALASDGQQAMTQLGAGCQPFAILLDLSMPVMDGRQFREMLAAKAEYADIPIIVITAAAKENADVPGVSEILTKPIPLQRLIEALRIEETRARTPERDAHSEAAP